MVPSGPRLMRKTHLLPKIFRFSGRGTTSYTPMISKLLFSSSQAASHMSASGRFIASAYVFGSGIVSTRARLARSLRARGPYDETEYRGSSPRTGIREARFGRDSVGVGSARPDLAVEVVGVVVHEVPVV